MTKGYSVLRVFSWSEITNHFYSSFIFLLKWVIKWRCWVQSILYSSKILFCFEFFFKWSFSKTLLRRWPTFWKSTFKMTTLFRRCLILFKSMLKRQGWFDLVQRSKFQRWITQRCFNVDLVLCDIMMSNQPKSNADTTLKCLLLLVKKILFSSEQDWSSGKFLEFKFAALTFQKSTKRLELYVQTKEINTFSYFNFRIEIRKSTIIIITNQLVLVMTCVRRWVYINCLSAFLKILKLSL